MKPTLKTFIAALIAGAALLAAAASAEPLVPILAWQCHEMDVPSVSQAVKRAGGRRVLDSRGS